MTGSCFAGGLELACPAPLISIITALLGKLFSEDPADCSIFGGLKGGLRGGLQGGLKGGLKGGFKGWFKGVGLEGVPQD